MRSKLSLPVAIVLLMALLVSGDALAGRRVKVYGKGKASSDKPAVTAKPGNSKLKPFAEMTKVMVVIEGLFTFYHDTTDNSMLMAITPEQFGAFPARRRFLQPVNDIDDVNGGNVEKTLRKLYKLNNNGDEWELSLQVHKAIGVE